MRVALQSQSGDASREIVIGHESHGTVSGEKIRHESQGRCSGLEAYSALPLGIRMEVVKSGSGGKGSQSDYHALSDQVRNETISSMFTTAAESMAGYASGEGAAAGTVAASSGTSAMGAVATTAWIGAAIYGVVRVYEKFNMYLDRAHGAPLTDEEIIKATNPRGIEQWLSKISGHTALKKLDPVFLLAKGLFGSSKNEDQIIRDRVRAQLREAGLVTDAFLVENPDGSTFDIGKDGGDPQYQLNVRNPMAGELVTMVAPLAMIVTTGDKKLTDDFTGYFVNAALSGAGADDFDMARANIAALYEKAGITPELAEQMLTARKERGEISEQEYKVYTAGMATLFNGVQSQSHLDDMLARVEKRQKLIDQILAQSPEVSTEELTKQLSAIE